MQGQGQKQYKNIWAESDIIACSHVAFVAYNYIPLTIWYGCAFIVNFQGWSQKADHRTPVLKLARPWKNKQKETEIWIKKDGSKPGSSSQD